MNGRISREEWRVSHKEYRRERQADEGKVKECIISHHFIYPPPPPHLQSQSIAIPPGPVAIPIPLSASLLNHLIATLSSLNHGLNTSQHF